MAFLNTSSTTQEKLLARQSLLPRKENIGATRSEWPTPSKLCSMKAHTPVAMISKLEPVTRERSSTLLASNNTKTSSTLSSSLEELKESRALLNKKRPLIFASVSYVLSSTSTWTPVLNKVTKPCELKRQSWWVWLPSTPALEKWDWAHPSLSFDAIN